MYLFALLSGGVDSSLIAALLSKINKKNKIFLLFNIEYDESVYADEISSSLGLRNHKLDVTKYEIENSIPLLPKIYSEPFSDSSQIPTYLISKKIKQHATVALGGDGGDELFGGYNRYIYYNKYKNIINYTPKFIKNLFFNLESSEFTSPYLFKLMDLFINDSSNNNYSRNKKIIEKLFKINDSKTFYESMINQNLPKNFFKDNIFSDKSSINLYYESNSKNFEQQMMNNDINYYLPDDILCKVDRASMYNSLEVRSPFLSKKLIEFSQTITINFKINKGTSKYLLKKILEIYFTKKFTGQNKDLEYQ